MRDRGSSVVGTEESCFDFVSSVHAAPSQKPNGKCSWIIYSGVIFNSNDTSSRIPISLLSCLVLLSRVVTQSPPSPRSIRCRTTLSCSARNGVREWGGGGEGGVSGGAASAVAEQQSYCELQIQICANVLLSWNSIKFNSFPLENIMPQSIQLFIPRR